MCRALNPCHDFLIAMNNCYKPKTKQPLFRKYLLCT